MSIDDPEARYLAERRLGRLATVAPNGTPQNKPVAYTWNADLGTVDIGGIGMDTSAKYANVARRPDVAFVVDDSTGGGQEGVRFVEVRGRAAQVTVARPPGSPLSTAVIRIHPRRVVSYNVGARGMRAYDVERG